jgi:hypothetical protein
MARLAEIKGVKMSVCKLPELTSFDLLEIFLQRTATNAAMIILLISTTSTAFGLMALSGTGRTARVAAPSAVGKTGQDPSTQLSYLLAFSPANFAEKRSLWKSFTQTDALQTVLESTERAVSYASLRFLRAINPQYTGQRRTKDRHPLVLSSQGFSTTPQKESKTLGLTLILAILPKFLKSNPVAAQFLVLK